jgi:Rrf2 family transcriptional regulator, cysteine metabolism repressor
MLSSRTQYALRALLDLCAHQDEGPVLIQDIAERQNIPLKYLQQILGAMREEGFVKSRKGPGGGYILAVKPEALTLGQVIRKMDGPLAPVSCVSQTQFDECGCPEPDTCPLKTTFGKVREAIAEVYDHVSFAKLQSDLLAADRLRRDALDFVI